jgi:hypothetical protein
MCHVRAEVANLFHVGHYCLLVAYSSDLNIQADCLRSWYIEVVCRNTHPLLSASMAAKILITASSIPFTREIAVRTTLRCGISVLSVVMDLITQHQ